MIDTRERNNYFISCYAEEFKKYIERRSIEISEYTLQTERRFVARFDKYIIEHTDERVPLTNEFLDEWLARKPYEKKLTQAKRLHSTSNLLSFLNKEGVQTEEIQLELHNAQSEYIPYIFTDEEIKRIIHAADSYESTSASPYLHLTVPITFRILYGCGLRCSELVHLKSSDIDMSNKVIYVHDAKFNKARYIPYSESLSRHICKYMTERHPKNDPDQYFISKTENRGYGTSQVHYWFMRILSKAGIPHYGKGYGPRVHDLRHTFAVHSLRKSVLEGRDINSMLPVLATYLGHKDLRGTQTYLRLTADLYPYITSALEQQYGFVVNGGAGNEK